jgi:translation initiation factor IF-2
MPTQDKKTIKKIVKVEKKAVAKETRPAVASSTSSTFTVRPPVVVVMGHIDHGKSTLLDYIRKTNVVAGEAGGITQHLGAYEVEHVVADSKAAGDSTGSAPKKITFIDTPGHEAFCDIRERGAHVADIAILVVSAEDGVKPQTLEALACIKDEKIPYIVAINKIDKPSANIDRTKINLAENEIYLEGYGGDVSFVPISALTGEGVPELLDLIMLTAEVADLRADEKKLGTGAIVEAHLDNKKGIGATLVIKDGHIETGSYVVAEGSFSPVRILEDFTDKPIIYATFSSPVSIVGWNKMPPVGSPFAVVMDKKKAEKMADEWKPAAATSMSTSAVLAQALKANPNTIILPLIIKTDTVGSLDGIKHELAKIKNDKVSIRIIIEGIGVVSESDVKTAQSNPSIIIVAFNAKPDNKAKSILERPTTAVNLKEFSVIYDLIEFVKKAVTEKVPKEYEEQSTGKAKILAIFSKNKDKQIIGGKVQEGEMVVGAEVKILRRDTDIGRGKIRELQQQKVKASSVREGYDFGALVESKIEIAIGDKIEGFKIVEKSA